MAATYTNIENIKELPISDATGITGGIEITNMIFITQADYDNIPTPDATTLYVIVI